MLPWNYLEPRAENKLVDKFNPKLSDRHKLCGYTEFGANPARITGLTSISYLRNYWVNI